MPAAGGLRMLPFLGGVLVASVVSGRRIRRHGRYKRYIVSGTSYGHRRASDADPVGAGTGAGPLAAWMFTIGAGLGLFSRT